MNTLVSAAKMLAANPAGQAALAFVRVFAATLVASWVHAGTPMPTATSLVSWVELGVQAGVALVLANYLGPWEQRYGINKKTTS